MSRAIWNGPRGDDGELVATIRRNAREEIRISRREVQGRAVIYARTFRFNGKEMTRTPQCISIGEERLAEMIAGWQAVRRRA